MPDLPDGAAVPVISSFFYPSDPQIIDKLKKSIDYFHKEMGGPLFPLPPTPQQLRELLDSCFAASLETEEGRAVAFTVCFFGDREVDFPYRLKESVDASPRNLASLAVALDPSRTRICVVPGNTSLQIAGLFHLGEQDLFRGARKSLNHLSIRVLGPGVMMAMYGGDVRFTYRKGKFAFHTGESDVEPHAVGGLLSHRRIDGLNTEELKKTFRFEKSIKWITRTMLRQRHGGTLLVLPDGTPLDDTARTKYSPSSPVTSVREANVFDIKRDAERNDTIRKVLEIQPSPEIVHLLGDASSHFAAELEWLGRLTATDGMTVITEDLTLLGFGVFFDTNEEKDPTQVLVVDLYNDTADHMSQSVGMIGGARHQSAAITCRRIPDARAIVASQDGSLTSMIWKPEERFVLAWRHIELLLDV
jgi:hypothetical protein